MSERLVIDEQFALFQHRTEVALQRRALALTRVGRRVEEAERPASFGFRAPERGVCIGEQRRLLVAVGRIDRDADAEADAHALALDLDVAGERILELLG